MIGLKLFRLSEGKATMVDSSSAKLETDPQVHQ